MSLRDTLFRAEIQSDIFYIKRVIKLLGNNIRVVISKLTLVLPDDCVLSLDLNSKDAAFNLIVGLEEEFVLDTGAEDGVDDIEFTGDEYIESTDDLNVLLIFCDFTVEVDMLRGDDLSGLRNKGNDLSPRISRSSKDFSFFLIKCNNVV